MATAARDSLARPLSPMERLSFFWGGRGLIQPAAGVNSVWWRTCFSAWSAASTILAGFVCAFIIT